VSFHKGHKQSTSLTETLT